MMPDIQGRMACDYIQQQPPRPPPKKNIFSKHKT